MQRLKDQGRDPAKPIFGVSGSNETVRDDDLVVQEVVSMTKPGVTRRITKEELAEHTNAENPWFVVKGEVRTTRIEVF
jgi:nitrate reductase (NAD(P)H)